MKKLRIAVLVHESLIPPDTVEGSSDEEIAEFKCEFDVVATLREMGHDVQTIGLLDDLTPLRNTIQEWKPDIAFVLLEEFHGVSTYDQAIVAYLELMKQPYTGCNPRGMVLSRDKALAKKILTHSRIPTPSFVDFPRGHAIKRPKRLNFPLFVKSAIEDASHGISLASIVRNDNELAERVRFVHDKVGSDAIVEEFIDGRELYVGILGNDRLKTFPIWEMIFDKLPEGTARIATRKVKWDEKYQKKFGITTQVAENLPSPLEEKIYRICKRVFRSLNMSGFARIDLRLAEDERVYVLEANANPNLAYGEDFAESAEHAGISYEELLSRIIKLGLNYQYHWRSAESS
ncbi:MAG: ATP-grasp domain-containing protein [Planctomycetales bacterium]